MKQCSMVRLGTTVTALVFALACSGDSASSSDTFRETRFQAAPCGVVWEVQYRLGNRLASIAPGAGYLSDYALTADGTFTSAAATDCTDQVAARLGALCEPCMAEPAQCENRIRALFAEPPSACNVCGDGVCLEGEDGQNCARDCAPRCGDGTCGGGEIALSCPVDCAIACGDGRCATNETPQSCPEDCQWAAGDGICEPGESAETSPEDCLNVACGDRFCQPWETRLLCPGDCCGAPQCSGDGTFCTGPNSVGACDPTEDLGCPIAVTSATCEFGCIGDSSGGRCRTCADVVLDNPGMVPCSPEAQPFCGNGSRSVVTCEPVPGFPSCYAQVDTVCDEGSFCDSGRCTACAPGLCEFGTQRCGPSGVVEECRPGFPSCAYWGLERSCPGGYVCDPSSPSFSCVACCTRAGERYCEAGSLLRECSAGGLACDTYEVVETCDAPQRCDIDTREPACDDCCEVGQTECSIEGEFQRRRVCSDAGTPGCGRWNEDGFCDPSWVCSPDPESPACVRPE